MLEATQEQKTRAAIADVFQRLYRDARVAAERGQRIADKYFKAVQENFRQKSALHDPTAMWRVSYADGLDHIRSVCIQFTEL